MVSSIYLPKWLLGAKQKQTVTSKLEENTSRIRDRKPAQIYVLGNLHGML
jgi:hypothetical protein